MELGMDIGAALTEACRESGLSFPAVSKLMGMRGNSTVVRWAAGEHCPSAIDYERLRALVPGFAARIDAQLGRPRTPSLPLVPCG
jgi:hypothetical protein